MNANMMKIQRKRLRIGLDCDDVLFECVSIAIRLANEQRSKEEKAPLKIDDVLRYGKTGTETDEILPYFSMKEFYELQTVVPGAREMIRRLIALGHEVFVITSIPAEIAPLRTKMLRAAFPELPPENIFCALRKDLFAVDIMLDDGPHHIVGDRRVAAKYPVLFRKPWNKNITGVRSVNNFAEFCDLVDAVSVSAAPIADRDHKVLCLVGPTGSGKTELIEEVIKNPFFGRLPTVTTNPNASDAYERVDDRTFGEMIDGGRFIEHSVYNGYNYGIRMSAIERLWQEGKHAVTCIDIAGAYLLKKIYGEGNVYVIYRKAETAEIIRNIIERNIPAEEKLAKISAMSEEMKNEESADLVIYPNSAEENAKLLSTVFA